MNAVFTQFMSKVTSYSKDYFDKFDWDELTVGRDGKISAAYDLAGQSWRSRGEIYQWHNALVEMFDKRKNQKLWTLL